MKGFKIKLEYLDIQPAVEHGVIILTFDPKTGISVSGTDFATGTDIDWGSYIWDDQRIVTITACEIDRKSNPQKQSEMDRSKLLGEVRTIKRFFEEKKVIKWRILL